MVDFSSERHRIRWIGVAVFVIVSAMTAGGVLSMEYFMDGFGVCKTVVHNSIPSPDGHKSIVIFEKQCGATVGFNTQASIAPAGSSFSSQGNPAFFVVSDTPEVVAKWLGDNVVEMAVVPRGGKVFKSEQTVGDIKIMCK
jgi:hypothetical protein